MNKKRGRSEADILRELTTGSFKREQERKERKGIINKLFHNIRRVDKNFGNETDIFYDKILFHNKLSSEGIRVPEIYAIMKKEKDWDVFWDKVKDIETFVLKPNRLSRGRGIHVLTKTEDPDIWLELNGQTTSIDRLKRDSLGVIRRDAQRRYAMFAEERIFCNDDLNMWGIKGSIVDFRMYMFNNEVLYAKMRCPTKKSEGFGNTSKNAVAMHINENGIIEKTKIMNNTTTKYNGKSYEGVKIPHWKEMVKTSCAASKIFGSPFHSMDLTVNKEGEVVIIESEKIPTLGHYSKEEASFLIDKIQKWCNTEMHKGVPKHRRGLRAK